MELKSRLETLAEKFKELKSEINTEEATKTAFVLPFIGLLGYNVFDPREVIPEFTADLGIKKGEKVDYAVIHDGKPIIIIECKHWKEKLSKHSSQLHRYFNVSKTKFGILTNGNSFLFFTDLSKPNIMDEKPFLTLSLNSLKDTTIQEVQKFHKDNFDASKITSNASSLKYIHEVKSIFEQEITETSDDFAKFFASRITSSMMTKKVVDLFKTIVPKGISQLISDKVSDRLQSAITKETVAEPIVIEEQSKIITTEEEIDAFRILVAILRKSIPVERVTHRDTQSYFGVLLDDNNRKPICRLYLDGRSKYIGLFDASKKEVKHLINSIDDIYNFGNELNETVKYYT